MMYSCAPAARGGSSATIKKRGKSLTVDIHCHYMNTEVAGKVTPLNPAQHEPMAVYSNAQTREVNANQVKERGPKLTDVALRLKDMDRMGIDIQALCPAPHQTYYWTEPGMGLTDARLSLEPFFAAVQKHDVIIFMHPIGFTQGERLVNHYFSNVIGNPLETTVAASHLIFDGVMERHPKLKVVLPHAGGYLAHYWARMDHAWRARPDCRTVLKKKPTESLEKLYFDTITFDRGMLAHLVERFGADHVLLGTDYPYDMGMEDPVGFIA